MKWNLSVVAVILSAAISCEKPDAPEIPVVPEIKVESISFSHTFEAIAEGLSASLSAVVEPSDATDRTIVWTSSDESVATVSQDGTVTAKKIGIAEIKAAAAGGSRYVTCNISVLPKGTVNLSEEETSNSYIVSEAGTYAFKMKMHYTAPSSMREEELRIRSVSVLWESYGDETPIEKGDLLGLDYVIGNYVVFTTTGKYGNAVISANMHNGASLWTWHIWMTDKPHDQVYRNGAGVFMDRNLGATSTEPDDLRSVGLLYQYARKDPFIPSLPDNLKIASTIEWPEPMYFRTSWEINNNPTVMWFDARSYNSFPFAYWNGSDKPKSVYDPCPSGYRVPDGGDRSEWATAAKDASALIRSSEYKYGADMSEYFLEDRTSICWYPVPDAATSYLSSTFFVDERFATRYPRGESIMSLDRSGEYIQMRPFNGITDKTRSCHVRCVRDDGKVPPKTVQPLAIELNEGYTTTMKVGQKQILSCTILPEDTTNKLINWDVYYVNYKNPAIMIDSVTGELTALAPGHGQVIGRVDNTRFEDVMVELDIKVVAD